MARRNRIDGTLLVGYGTVDILEVTGVVEAIRIRISKVYEPTWEVSMTGRSRINSALLVGYGAVDILEVASVFETL